MAGDFTTEYLLIQWGRWAFQNRGVSLNYPSIEPYARLVTKSPPSAQITDELACEVDQTLAGMSRFDRVAHNAVALYFLTGMPYSKLGRELGIDKAAAWHAVSRGVAWMDGALNGVETPAP